MKCISLLLLLAFNVNSSKEIGFGKSEETSYESELPLEILESAEDGNSYAQYLIAIYYQETNTESRNLEQAAYWFEKAANQGDPDAALELGQIYSVGVGSYEKSCKQSVYWSKKAAEAGIFVAWNNIAWELSICEDKSFRDGKKALEIMQKHGEAIGQTAGVLDTFAAAYAELGQFDKAITTQEIAISLIKDSENKARVESMQARLNLYKQGKTWSGFAHSNTEKYTE